MIYILSLGNNNAQSISNIYKKLGIKHIITNKLNNLEKKVKIIVPGIGHFDEVINRLRYLKLDDKLNQLVIEEKFPILGICVGMQIFLKKSEEGKEKGLGWLKGKVQKINSNIMLPHMGWNSLEKRKNNILLKKIDLLKGFYFLHSYYLLVDNKKNIIAQTFYGDNFASVVNEKNIYGVQFHPEKSHQNGIQLLNNFAEL